MTKPKGDVPSWARSTRPIIDEKLRKPKAVSLAMLERWDVCYDAHEWLKNAPGLQGYFQLNERFIEEAFGSYTIQKGFKLTWLAQLCDHLMEDLVRQAKKPSSRIALNKLRSSYNAGVASADLNLSDDTQGSGAEAAVKIRLAQQLVQLINNL